MPECLHYDVVIVGGGTVGNSAALAFSSLGISVLVVEASCPKQRLVTDGRFLALSLSSINIYRTLGLWSDLMMQASPITAINISEQSRFGKARLIAQDAGLDAFGYVVAADHLNAQLARMCAKQSTINYLFSTQIVAIEQGSNGVKLQLDGNDTLLNVSASLLIGADGAKSTVRSLQGIEHKEHDYQQSAIVANVSPKYVTAGLAYERFAGKSVLALLPLKEQRCGLVWVAPNADCQQLLDLSDADFAKHIATLLGYRKGSLTAIGKRYCFPLKQICASEQVRAHLVLLGSSAHHLHPVAAQGLNLALRDMAAVADHVAEALARGQEFGSLELLQQYQRDRAADQARVLAVTDSLIKLFASNAILLNWSRSWGLLLFDLLNHSKYTLVQQAFGGGGLLPRLACGLPLLRRALSDTAL